MMEDIWKKPIFPRHTRKESKATGVYCHQCSEDYSNDFNPVIKYKMMIMKLVSLMFTFYQILMENAFEKSCLNFHLFKFYKLIVCHMMH